MLTARRHGLSLATSGRINGNRLEPKKRPRRVFFQKQKCCQRILLLGSRLCRLLWRCNLGGSLGLWSYRRRGHWNSFQRSTLIPQGFDFRKDLVFAFGQLRDACADLCNDLCCFRDGSFLHRCFDDGLYHFRGSRYLLRNCRSLWSGFLRSCHFQISFLFTWFRYFASAVLSQVFLIVKFETACGQQRSFKSRPERRRTLRVVVRTIGCAEREHMKAPLARRLFSDGGVLSV